VDSFLLYKMRKVFSELSTKKGRGTELVSLYIPPKKPIHEVASALRDEYGTASNIKSDLTRTHVQDALVKTMQRLKLYDRPPENGLAIFCGALPTDGPGSEVVSLYEVLPPKPIQTYLYRCDDHFHLEPLKEMLKEEKVIGILSIDTTEAGLGIISGDRYEMIEVVTSGVSGKHRAGGQSARRFERLREMELTDYFNRLARHAKEAFIDSSSVQGILVSGPGHTKNDFLKGSYLDYRLQNNVLSVIDTSYSGSEGVRETVARSEKILEDLRVVEEKKLVDRFLREVNSAEGLAVYGFEEISSLLKRGGVETILVSEDLGRIRLSLICKACENRLDMIVDRDDLIRIKQEMLAKPCSKCGGSDHDVEEKDLIEYLADLAGDSNAKLEVISSKTEEGVMLKSFGGVAALLKYR